MLVSKSLNRVCWLFRMEQMVREADKDGKPEIMTTTRTKQEAKVEGRNKAKRKAMEINSFLR